MADWHDQRVFCFPPQPDYRPADRVTEMFLLPFIATSLTQDPVATLV